ncbi:MAG: Holliday junction branch migration protein RuvA [Sphaerochaeta sp.]
MINAVIGNIVELKDDRVIVRCGYVEYIVFISAQTAAQISNLPSKHDVRIITYMQVREDSMSLYGFLSEKERDVFLQLQTVSGIAAKGALKILSGITLADLIKSLDEGNVKALSKIPGIGSKTAGRLILALRGKLVLDEENDAVIAKGSTLSPYKDLINALFEMGYDRNSCEKAINKVVSDNHDALIKMNEKEKEQTLFRLAMRELN